MTFLYNDTVKFSEDVADAFGRLRVSNPYPLFSSQFQFDKQPDLWSEKVVGSASATHLPNESSVLLTVGTAAGDRVVRQTIRYIRYYPARGQSIAMTGVLGSPKTGVVARIGYFDDDNGVFFEMNQNGLAVVQRSKASGSVVETRIQQANWNGDKMNGTGPSGITLDPTKAQIFSMDLQWLGVGRVRFAVNIDGLWHKVHEIDNANALPGVYMTTANLPCRVELRNTTATASGTSMKQICTAVLSEGGYTEGGYLRSGGLGNTPKTVPVGTVVPLITFRLKAAYARAVANPLNYSILNTSNSYLRYVMYINPVLTNPVWTSVSEAMEMDKSATGFTGGHPALEGYLNTRDQIEIRSNSGDNLFSFASDIDGNPITLMIAAEGVGGSGSVYASMTWREIR